MSKKRFVGRFVVNVVDVVVIVVDVVVIVVDIVVIVDVDKETGGEANNGFLTVDQVALDPFFLRLLLAYLKKHNKMKMQVFGDTSWH